MKPDENPAWLEPSRPFARSNKPAQQATAMKLIAAGLEILEEEGIGLVAENVTLSKALSRVNESSEDVNLSPGSVYNRLWVKPEDFRADVLSAALYNWFAPQENNEHESTFTAVEDVLAKADLTTVNGRTQTLKTLARIAGKTNDERIDAIGLWSKRTAILAALAAQDQETAVHFGGLHQAAAQAYSDSTKAYTDLYDLLMQTLKMRPRSDLFGTEAPEAASTEALLAFARMATALSEGLALRKPFDETATINLPDGEISQEWTLFGLGLWSLAQTLFEPIPDGN